TQVGPRPVAPDQNSFTPPPALQELMNWTPTTPAPVVAPAAGDGGGGGSWSSGQSVADAIAAMLKAGYGDANQRTTAGLPTQQQPKPVGGVASSAPLAYSGVPNEMVAGLTSG